MYYVNRKINLGQGKIIFENRSFSYTLGACVELLDILGKKRG